MADDNRDAEIPQLKRELARVTEERDILKKPPRISQGMPSEIRVYRRASFALSNTPTITRFHLNPWIDTAKSFRRREHMTTKSEGTPSPVMRVFITVSDRSWLMLPPLQRRLRPALAA